MSERNPLEREERGARALDERAEAQNREHGELANIQPESGFAGANKPANKGRDCANLGQEPPEWDALATPPKADPLMFYGLLGRFARQAAEGTEVNPVAAMAAAMTWLSGSMGRNPVIHVGNDWHRLNLFAKHVGRSSRGGKNMALGLLKDVIKVIGKLPDGAALCPQMHSGGLSSREGLAWLIHDGYKQGKEEFLPIADKRLFVVETEFANVLAQGKRDNNTLSTALRDAWDGGSIKPAVKGCRVWATRTHIALYGCITPGELRSRMASNDLSNGFANRFMIFWAERQGCIPFPQRARDEVADGFAQEFGKIIRHGLGGYPSETSPRVLRMSKQGAGLYADCYREFRQPHPAGELITGLLERRAPMLLRISGLFAMTDLQDEICRKHIEAAKCWMDYYTGSVAMIFAPTVDAEAEAHRNEDAEKLLAWLRDRGGWQARTAIIKVCFSGHLPADAINTALERLSLEGRIERRDVGDKGTKKRTEYRLASGETPKFAIASQQSSQARSPVASTSSHVRNVRSSGDESSQGIEGEV